MKKQEVYVNGCFGGAFVFGDSEATKLKHRGHMVNYCLHRSLVMNVGKESTSSPFRQ